MQHIVPAEVAQRVAQHGQGLVHLPEDVVATLDGYFKGQREAAALRALPQWHGRKFSVVLWLALVGVVACAMSVLGSSPGYIMV